METSKIILAIETSCDETGIAIIKDGKLIANKLISQIDLFVHYGGVIPELAARLHEYNFPYVLQESLNEAKITLNEVDMIAYTFAPGLIGALQIGAIFAKTLAISLDIPLIPIHHLEGHIHAANIDDKIIYPAMALIVSGGHTELVYMKEAFSYDIVGTTRDDAVGECYDKVARILKLGYPGGPKIDALSREGHPAYKLPMPLDDDSLDFSFSGLKSSFINLYNKLMRSHELINDADLAASLQYSAITILQKKTKRALQKYPSKSLVIAGGVSANSYLRKVFNDLHDTKVIIPKIQYCTDNGAMIAQAAWDRFSANNFENNYFKESISSEELK